MRHPQTQSSPLSCQSTPSLRRHICASQFTSTHYSIRILSPCCSLTVPEYHSASYISWKYERATAGQNTRIPLPTKLKFFSSIAGEAVVCDAAVVLSGIAGEGEWTTGNAMQSSSNRKQLRSLFLGVLCEGSTG